MRKAIIILLTTLLFTTSCSDSFFDMIDAMDHEFPLCVDSSGTAAAPDGKGWLNAYTSIQDAVNAATDGDRIWVKAGTYDGISITKAVIIYGGFSGNGSERSTDNSITVISSTVSFSGSEVTSETVLDCFQLTNEPMVISGGAAPTINNCRFESISYTGNGGALQISSSSAAISECTFSGCSATGNGGAIYAADSINITISNCSFTGNESQISSTVNPLYGGGAVFADTTTLSISNSTFSNNIAVTNGGVVYAADSSEITISNCSFTDNESQSTSAVDYGGGAIYSTSSSRVTIRDNSIFSKNKAGYNGGAIWAGGNSTIEINNSLFGGEETDAGNSAEFNGGAIYTRDSTVKLTISSSNFISNNNTSINYGGAIYIVGSELNIENSTFDNNTCISGGGAIFSEVNTSAKVTITNSEFNENSTSGFGGAISFDRGELTINRCSFSYNNAIGSYGGAIIIQHTGTYTVTNSIFYRNTCATSGGAIYLPETTVASNLINLTFFNNSSFSRGGALYLNSNNIQVYNCIFNNNTAPNDNSDNIYNNTTTETFYINYSFIINGIGTNGSAFDMVSCVTSGDPFISIDENNSNFLYPSSVVRDAGLDAAPGITATDLAGNPRIVNGRVDMGAYEWQE
ncbi:MAG: right-handed parallel beta-helix repeat-containing protein [Spirochaetes bacterium]|nr:right-handed parallel beta-helix repeat-containing protein [Spirochaetota bacterium]